MSTGNNGLSLNCSNGVQLNVWRNDGLFTVAREDADAEPQICLGVDLFEVIAELGGLDLESDDAANEATKLAEQAQRVLSRS
jgi:hypothetical protein